MKRNFYELLLILLVVLISFNVKGQPIPLNPYAKKVRHQINHIDKYLDSNYVKQLFEIDSISINGKLWKNKIETENFFIKSGTSLKIEYYLNKDKLIFIKVTETSRTLGGLASSICEFYYKNEKQVYKWTYYKRPTGIAMKPDDDIKEIYGYNKCLTEEFLNAYLEILFRKLKTTHNSC